MVAIPRSRMVVHRLDGRHLSPPPSLRSGPRGTPQPQRILLSRVGFGGTPEEAFRLAGMPLEQAVDTLLDEAERRFTAPSRLGPRRLGPYLAHAMATTRWASTLILLRARRQAPEPSARPMRTTGFATWSRRGLRSASRWSFFGTATSPVRARRSGSPRLSTSSMLSSRSRRSATSEPSFAR